MRKLLVAAVAIILVLACLGAALAYNLAPTIHYGFNYDYTYKKIGEQWYTINWVEDNQTQGTLVSVECNNTGSMAGTFSIVVAFNNATISPQTSQPYTMVDNSTAKFPVTLSENGHRAFYVYFDIDSDAMGFNVDVAFESSQLFIHSEQSSRWGYLGVSFAATNASRIDFIQLV
jgi:hypothetical protein